MTVPPGLISGEPLPLRQSFVERNNIHPILFAFASLAIVFVLYQVGGALLTLVFVGGTFSRENVGVVRTLTMGGQLTLIFLPTLLLARLLSTNVGGVFRWRIPSLKESFLAFIALLSLQRLFEAYMYFQNLIPLPRILKDIIEPMKRMFEEILKTLVKAESIPELLFVVLVVALVPAIVEELLFRGLIQATFERVMTPLSAALVSGALFGLFHLNPFDVVPLVGLGCFLGLLRYRSQSMIVPMGVHLMNNLMAVLAVYLRVEDEELLGTGRFGLPGTVMVLIQVILFGAVFAYAFGAYLKSTRNLEIPETI